MADDRFWADALTRAEAADQDDPLAGFRSRFRLPSGVIYLDGNSLGPAPEAALEALEVAAREEWAGDLIASWNRAGWFDLPLSCGDLLAPVIGADAGEVVVCDSVSVNVFKCLQAAISMRPERRVIVAEGGSFPTDLYMVQGVLSLRPDLELRLEGRDGDDLVDLIDDSVAVVVVNQVDYRTGRIRDLAELTARAHECGTLVIWDLCHSAGVMDVGLNAAHADMAVGCTYKYLNGGPGAPAFVYAASRHHGALHQPLSGWWGHAAPFGFEPDYRPAEGIRRFLCGTQPVLSFRAMQAGLRLAAKADLGQVRAKSMELTQAFLNLAMESCEEFGVGLLSPRAAEMRGSQVALTHPEGYAVVQAMVARGVVGDFRMPDIMRFGFAPLFLRHADVVRAARILHEVLRGRVWDDPQYSTRATVT